LSPLEEAGELITIFVNFISFNRSTLNITIIKYPKGCHFRLCPLNFYQIIYIPESDILDGISLDIGFSKCTQDVIMIKFFKVLKMQLCDVTGKISLL
jgi:hypothetical protein